MRAQILNIFLIIPRQCLHKTKVADGQGSKKVTATKTEERKENPWRTPGERATATSRFMQHSRQPSAHWAALGPKNPKSRFGIDFSRNGLTSTALVSFKFASHHRRRQHGCRASVDESHGVIGCLLSCVVQGPVGIPRP
jgi:hypothetical protein